MYYYQSSSTEAIGDLAVRPGFFGSFVVGFTAFCGIVIHLVTE